LETAAETNTGPVINKQPKPGKRRLLLLGIFVLVLGLAVASVVYFSGLLSPESPQSAEVKISVNEVLQLEPFVLNLAGNSALELHYLRVGLGFGFYNPTPKNPVVDPRMLMPKLKDSLLVNIGKKTAEEMVSADGKESLKQAVAEAAKGVIPPERGQLLEIYITEFIVQ
jgi:flagellar basal body-associated protein FliL